MSSSIIIYFFKRVLKCFELVSGLKMKFYKSKMSWKESTHAVILSCTKMFLPFTRLGFREKYKKKG